MNDTKIQDIVKALECCSGLHLYPQCYSCPYLPQIDCRPKLMRDALQVIEHLRPETP